MAKGTSVVIGIIMFVIAGAILGVTYMYIANIFNTKTSTVFSITSPTEDHVIITHEGTAPVQQFSALFNGTKIPAYLECSQIIFSDNFNDGDSLGWTVDSGSWSVSAGSYRGDAITSNTAESYANLSVTTATTDFYFKIHETKAVDVMMIIDRSGSMDDDCPGGQANPGETPCKINDAKTAAKIFVDQLNASKDRSGLVSFATTATLNQALASNQTLVKNSIDTLTASGNTNIGAAIYTATNQLRANGNPDADWVEILLTDGRANRPLGVNPDQYAINASINASTYGIAIYTIGLGADVDPDVLQQIASTTGGKYYYAQEGGALTEQWLAIYAQIAGDIVAPGEAGIVLKQGSANITVMIKEGDDVVEILDSNGNIIASGQFEVDTNILYKGKIALDGENMFVSIDDEDIATAKVGSLSVNRLSLLSKGSITVFDDILVTGNILYPGNSCALHLYNFTKQPGRHLVSIRSPAFTQQAVITVD